MRQSSLGAIVLLLIVCGSCLAEAKRSYSIGRSRKKSASNINVRRKGAVPETRPVPAAPDAPHSAVGPPPAYPGMGHNPAAPYGAPPAYSQGYAAPPSYAAAVAGSSNIGRIPPRGAVAQQSGMGYHDSTSFRGLGQGHNAFGAPSQAAGLYNAHGGGGFSGPGVYGSNYGYGQRGASPFSFGNILTGLAVWNIARGFNSYNRPQHIYIDNREKTTAGAAPEAVPVDDGSAVVVDEQLGSTWQPEATSSEEDTSEMSGTESTLLDPYFYATIHPSLLIYARHVDSQYTRTTLSEPSSAVNPSSPQ